MHIEHIENWIFDLDNTLYPVECGLYQSMDIRIREFVARKLNLSQDDAHKVQKHFFREHGTTLSGMMAEHGTDPYEYLEDVHQFAIDTLKDAPRLTEKIMALPGRKIIFTNADAPYARRVLKQLDLDGVFEIIVDIHACEYRPKPSQAAYDTLLKMTDIDPKKSMFFEDMARNLPPAKKMGMKTLWLNVGSELAHLDNDAAHIDFETDNLAAWLDTAIETLK